jgi:preprotein translocase subunit SecA
MSIVNKILGGLFGNKSEKDVSEIQPLLIKINEETERIVKLSNDQLREETAKIKSRINDFVKEERDEINSIKGKLSLKRLMSVRSKICTTG